MEKSEESGRLARAIAFFAICIVLCAFAVLMQKYWQAVSLDIAVYWEAGTRMRDGGAQLYKEPTDPANDVGRFIYPPTFAVLFAPLTFLPRWLGYGVWGLVQVAAIAVSLFALRGVCKVSPRDKFDFWLIVLISIFGAAWENIREGQVNFIVLACVSLGLWRIVSGKPLSGGMLIGLAAHLKIIPGVLIAVLLVQRRWRAALGMGLGMALIYFSPLLWTVPNLGMSAGIERNQALTRQYIDEVAMPRAKVQQATTVGGVRAPNNALSAVVHRYFSDNVFVALHSSQEGPLLYVANKTFTRWAGFAIAAALYLLALALGLFRRSDLSFVASCGLAYSAATMGNLLCWPHHFAALALFMAPLAALALREKRIMPRTIAATAALALFCHLVLLEELEVFQIYGLPTLGALIAWGVCFYTFWKERQSALHFAP